MSKHTPDEADALRALMGKLVRRHRPGPGPDTINAVLENGAEELARQKDLIAIYERDRTRHLRSIEGADTDLAELGESLGEEIERLKASESGWMGARREEMEENKRLELSIESYEAALAEGVHYVNQLENQRDELLALLRRALNESARVHPDFADEIRAAITEATP